jgi:hypothetical protein
MKEGQGKMDFGNGDIYVGSWRKGNKEGLGRFVYAVDGKSSLPGCNFSWNAGDVYEGGFKAGTRHGACTYTFFSGETAQFTWVDGVCHEFNARQAAVLLAHSTVLVFPVKNLTFIC